MKLPILLLILLKVYLLVFTVGCIGLGGGGDLQPAYYYTLESVEAPPAAASTAGAPIAVGLDRIVFPDFLNRKEIALRTGGNQVRFTANHLWAERPGDGFQRLLSLNIERQASLPVEVYGLPWPDHSEPDWVVYLEVQSFEGREGAETAVTLDVTWSIRPVRGDGRVKEGSYQASGLEWTRGDYASLAAGLSEGLIHLGRLIAKDIEELAQM